MPGLGMCGEREGCWEQGKGTRMGYGHSGKGDEEGCEGECLGGQVMGSPLPMGPHRRMRRLGWGSLACGHKH